MHGIPEEIATDGGSTYMAYETQKFLSEYGVRHRVSSVAYPHTNQRAELAVKSMKRLCRQNTNRDGSLNNDKFLRAVMAYRQRYRKVSSTGYIWKGIERLPTSTTQEIPASTTMDSVERG